MASHAEIQQEIRRYLLGTLPEDAGRRVEERLMSEVAFLEELSMAEGELIDDYVGERLDDAERADFERHFLSTEERRRQLRFARMLSRLAAASATAAEPSPVVEKADAPARGREPVRPVAPTFGERWRAFRGGLSWGTRAGLAVAAVAVIAFALWLSIPRAPRTFVALTLVAEAGNRASGVEAPRVRLPLGADALRLTLTLPAGTVPAAAYRADLLTGEGHTEPVEVAGHDERSVSVVVPEARLARGRYILQLFATGPDKSERRIGDSYVFDVE